MAATDPATVQGYITIPNGRFASVFSGSILSETAGQTQATPSAVYIEGHMFRIDHVVLDVDQNAGTPVAVGFKLDYMQTPCSSNIYRAGGNRAQTVLLLLS